MSMYEDFEDEGGGSAADWMAYQQKRRQYQQRAGLAGDLLKRLGLNARATQGDAVGIANYVRSMIMGGGSVADAEAYAQQARARPGYDTTYRGGGGGGGFGGSTGPNTAMPALVAALRGNTGGGGFDRRLDADPTFDPGYEDLSDIPAPAPAPANDVNGAISDAAKKYTPASMSISDLINRSALAGGMSSEFMSSGLWNKLNPFMSSLAALQGLVAPGLAKTDIVNGMGGLNAQDLYAALVRQSQGNAEEAEFVDSSFASDPNLINPVANALGFGNMGMELMLPNFIKNVLMPRYMAKQGEYTQSGTTILDLLSQYLRPRG